VELKSRRNLVWVYPNLYLDYFWFFGHFQFSLIWEENRIGQNFSVLLHISWRNHPPFDFSLVFRILCFVYFFTVLHNHFEFRAFFLLLLYNSYLFDRFFLILATHKFSQFTELRLYCLQLSLLFFKPSFIILTRLDLFVSKSSQQFNLLVVFLMTMFELGQLSFQHLPFSFSYVFTICHLCVSFGFVYHPWVVFVIMLSEGLFKLHEVSVLLQPHLFSLLCLLLGLL